MLLKEKRVDGPAPVYSLALPARMWLSGLRQVLSDKRGGVARTCMAEPHGTQRSAHHFRTTGTRPAAGRLPPDPFAVGGRSTRPCWACAVTPPPVRALGRTRLRSPAQPDPARPGGHQRAQLWCRGRDRPGERGDFYLLRLPLRGRARLRCNGQEAWVDSEVMSVLQPRAQTRMVWSGDCAMIMLQVPSRVLHSEAEHTGPLPAFNLTRSRQDPAVAAWWQAVGDMTRNLHDHGAQWYPGGILCHGRFPADRPGAVAPCLRHRSAHDTRPQRKPWPAPRSGIFRLHAHAHESLTLAGIAAAACVSPRTLEAAFRRRYDACPAQLRPRRAAGAGARTPATRSARRHPDVGDGRGAAPWVHPHGPVRVLLQTALRLFTVGQPARAVMPGATPARRAVCTRCLRPHTTCLCQWIAPTTHTVDVVVLQHPLEVHNAKGSARLLHLSLPNSRLLVGEVFDPQVLHDGQPPPPDAAARCHRQAVLLYPQPRGSAAPGLPRRRVDARPAARPRTVAPGRAGRHVAQEPQVARPQSLRLQALPRLALRDPPPSRYLIRKAHGPTSCPPWRRSVPHCRNWREPQYRCSPYWRHSTDSWHNRTTTRPSAAMPPTGANLRLRRRLAPQQRHAGPRVPPSFRPASPHQRVARQG